MSVIMSICDNPASLETSELMLIVISKHRADLFSYNVCGQMIKVTRIKGPSVNK